MGGQGGLDPTPFGKQTWFRLEGPSGEPIDVTSVTSPSSPRSVHLRCHVTGAATSTTAAGRCPQRRTLCADTAIRCSGINGWRCRRSACANFFLPGNSLRQKLAAPKLGARVQSHLSPSTDPPPPPPPPPPPATPLAIIRPCHDVQCRSATLPPPLFLPCPSSSPSSSLDAGPAGGKHATAHGESHGGGARSRRCEVGWSAPWVPRPVLQRLGGGGRGGAEASVGAKSAGSIMRSRRATLSSRRTDLGLAR